MINNMNLTANIDAPEDSFEESRESNIWSEAQEVIFQVEEAMLKKIRSIKPGDKLYVNLTKLEKSIRDIFSAFQEDPFRKELLTATSEVLDRDRLKDMILSRVKSLDDGSSGIDRDSEPYGGFYFASVIDEVLNGVE